jgi:dihydroxyacid dehydratase/phosphogluconate dehydratase
MAHAARVEMTLNEFRRLSKETPVLADLRPRGKYVMDDLFEIGGAEADAARATARRELPHRHRQDPDREPRRHPRPGGRAA